SSATAEKQGSGDDPSRNGDDASRNGDDPHHARKTIESASGDDGDGGDDLSPPPSDSGGRPIIVQLSGGRTIKVAGLDALPCDAIYWCREGDKQWTTVTRT